MKFLFRCGHVESVRNLPKKPGSYKQWEMDVEVEVIRNPRTEKMDTRWEPRCKPRNPKGCREKAEPLETFLLNFQPPKPGDNKFLFGTPNQDVVILIALPEI